MHNIGSQLDVYHGARDRQAALLAPGKACLTLPLGDAGIAPGHAAAPGAASAAAPGDEDEEGLDEPPEVKQFMQELGEGGGGGRGAGAGVPEEGSPTGAPHPARSVVIGPLQPDKRWPPALFRWQPALTICALSIPNGVCAPEERAPTGAPHPARSVEIGPQQPDRREGANQVRCRGPQGEQGPDHVRQIDVHSEQAVGRLQVQAVPRTFPRACCSGCAGRDCRA